MVPPGLFRLAPTIQDCTELSLLIKRKTLGYNSKIVGDTSYEKQVKAYLQKGGKVQILEPTPEPKNPLRIMDEASTSPLEFQEQLGSSIL